MDDPPKAGDTTSNSRRMVPTYINALQDAQAGHGSAAFDRLLYERLDSTLEETLRASREALTAPKIPAPAKPKGDEPAPG